VNSCCRCRGRVLLLLLLLLDLPAWATRPKWAEGAETTASPTPGSRVDPSSSHGRTGHLGGIMVLLRDGCNTKFHSEGTLIHPLFSPTPASLPSPARLALPSVKAPPHPVTYSVGRALSSAAFERLLRTVSYRGLVCFVALGCKLASRFSLFLFLNFYPPFVFPPSLSCKLPAAPHPSKRREIPAFDWGATLQLFAR